MEKLKNQNDIEKAIDNSRIWQLATMEGINAELRIFLLTHNELPNGLKLKANFNPLLVQQYLNKKYGKEIVWTKYFERKESSGNKIIKGDCDLFAQINKGIMIDIDNKSINILFKNEIPLKEISALKTQFLKCISKEVVKKKTFNIIKLNSYNSLELATFNIRNMQLDVNLNYNDDLSEIHSKIENFLNLNEQNGVLLFHGIPGSGKTSYLRHLISTCDARFIFVPNNLFHELSNPGFIDFIGEYPNSIIILEDCEDLLKPRTDNNLNSGISTLLNLGDGLLGDALQIKIICTFNTELKNIDQALLRKGRLFQRYEFKALSVEKSNNFLERRNIPNRVIKPTALADLYTILENNGAGKTEPESKIGFSL
jgi:hypothetical protein